MGSRRNSRVVVTDRLRDQVFDMLRNEIRTGVYSPGDRLIEVEVAEHFGVSRTPVREALIQLARTGVLVESERGYMLPVLTFQERLDWSEARLHIEPLVVRRAAMYATPAQIRLLEKALEDERRAVAANDVSKLLEVNHKFRSTLWSMCASAILRRAVDSLDDLFYAVRGAGLRERSRDTGALENHRRIVDAISQHDPAKAETEMRNFLVAALNELTASGIAVEIEVAPSVGIAAKPSHIDTEAHRSHEEVEVKSGRAKGAIRRVTSSTSPEAHAQSEVRDAPNPASASLASRRAALKPLGRKRA